MPESGGKTRQLVTEKARRISACRLTLFTERGGGEELRQNGAFVRDAISPGGVIDERLGSWNALTQLTHRMR